MALANLLLQRYQLIPASLANFLGNLNKAACQAESITHIPGFALCCQKSPMEPNEGKLGPAFRLLHVSATYSFAKEKMKSMFLAA